ncbi:MAG: helix-turn-helix transcriptional regulator [Chloroflexi bacterium]|nr:helix-turn-helix transcriptional regulator [Chloroflexota bacterium]
MNSMNSMNSKNSWDRHRIRALRRRMGWTQREMAAELGTRQQTISEWELGLYAPRGASARLLSLVAEKAGEGYGEEVASSE